MNTLNIRTPKVITGIILNGKVWFYNAVMHLKDADGMANSVDSDQAAL